MSHSSGKLQQGYKDGVRDAKFSWTDTSASWLWMWMMEHDYELGYEQGWKAGRSEARLRRMQEQRRSEPGQRDG
jgi:hypothetical protein